MNLANDRNVAGQARHDSRVGCLFGCHTNSRILKMLFYNGNTCRWYFFRGWVVPANFNKFGIFSTSYLLRKHVHVSHLMNALFVGASLAPHFFCGRGWDRKRTAQLVTVSLAKSPRGVLRAVTCNKRKGGVIFLGWSLVRYLKKKKNTHEDGMHFKV